MRACEVPHCRDHARSFSRYCRRHDQRTTNTGHPEGTNVLRGEYKTLFLLAHQFITHHKEHPGIRAGLEWLGGMMADGRDPGTIHARSSAADRLGRWLHQMQTEGVTAEDMLATIGAIYALREWNPRRFLSDRHFDHQLAIRVLRLTPAPFSERWSEGKPKKVYDRITGPTRDLLSTRINAALGPLILRMGREVASAAQPRPQERLEGIDFPFNPKGTYP
ncbi:hypothetical protein amb4049 [Paramagnetospirillum magneticum AMB-1]|uniref:Uncharacterized protein n=1 Tax=Paramagnetospirillum magneticum (strain ATCC 700264 / AMB-1) TaxID=342108 RepID=Q2VZX2_PARM1|nr:hypothetical protein amb4049 [Paramagnetospirillum magneticum AMB-1]